MARWIVNCIITGVVFWIASMLFPSVIVITGKYTILEAAVILGFCEIAVLLIIFLMALFTFFTGNWIGIICAFISVFFAEIVALSLLSAWLPGLTIIGFWPKFLLALALSIFRIPYPNNQS